MKPHQTAADLRPFKCREDMQADLEADLDSRYRKLAIGSVVAAVSQSRKGAAGEQTTSKE